MKAKVLVSFVDKENKITQPVGKILDLTEERFNAIMEVNPKLLEVVDGTEGDNKPEFPKHIGGGFYELSNGEKVKGKEAAAKAQEAIDTSEEPDNADATE